jgi:hypothetical protein
MCPPNGWCSSTVTPAPTGAELAKCPMNRDKGSCSNDDTCVWNVKVINTCVHPVGADATAPAGMTCGINESPYFDIA